jgi:ribosomal protein L35AE/L33A
MEKSDYLLTTICSVNFAEISQIDYTRISQNKTSIEVKLKSSEEWNSIYFTPTTVDATHDHDVDDAGNVFVNTLSFKYPGDGKTVPGNIIDIQNKRGVIHYIYSNGIVKTFGTIENPVVCSCSFSLSDAAWDISFVQKDCLPALMLVNP